MDNLNEDRVTAIVEEHAAAWAREPGCIEEFMLSDSGMNWQSLMTNSSRTRT